MKKTHRNAEWYSQNYIFIYRNASGVSGLQIEWVTGGTGCWLTAHFKILTDEGIEGRSFFLFIFPAQ